MSSGGFPFVTIGSVQPLKKHLTHAAQISLLKSRGLSISDDATAERILTHYGYYRLAGYSFPLREAPRPEGEPSPFKPEASLELVCQIAEFDKSLRLLVLNAIETIEIATRVAIAYRLGKYDPEAHLMPQFMDGNFTKRPTDPKKTQSSHAEWVQKFQDTVLASKEDFVLHHTNTYGGKMPIWVGVELWSFGMLSRFFEGIKFQDRQQIANGFGGLSGEVFGSWLRNLSFARNVAAHHARLWNRTNSIEPKFPPWERAPKLMHLRDVSSRPTKIYTTLCLLRTLLASCQSDQEWHTKLKNLARTFPSTPLISLTAAGFPIDWETLPLWA